MNNIIKGTWGRQKKPSTPSFSFDEYPGNNVKNVVEVFNTLVITEAISNSLHIIRNYFEVFSDQKQLKENYQLYKNAVTKSLWTINKTRELLTWDGDQPPIAKEWPAEKQSDFVIALLLIKQELGVFEREIFDIIVDRVQISPKTVENHLKNLSRWSNVMDGIRKSTSIKTETPNKLIVDLKNIFSGEVAFVMKLVRSNTANSLEKRPNDGYKFGVDYENIKFEKSNLTIVRTDADNNSAELAFGTLKIDPNNQWIKTITASQSRSFSDKSNDKDDHGNPILKVRVDIVMTPRRNNVYEKLTKLATLLSEQHWHNNILQVFGVIEIMDERRKPDVSAIYLLSDGRHRTTLGDVLKPTHPVKYTPIQRLDILAGVADALSYLHGIKVYHKCIDDQSIIIDTTDADNPVSKITNFGQSRFSDVRSNPPAHANHRSIWTSPNYAPGETKFDWADDVYSLGVVMFAVGAWMDMEEVEQLDEVSDEGYAIAKDTYGDKFVSAVVNCVESKVVQRNTAKHARMMLEELQTTLK